MYLVATLLRLEARRRLNAAQFEKFEFVPERPHVTGNSKLTKGTITSDKVEDTTYAHFKNWIEAMVAKDPGLR